MSEGWLWVCFLFFCSSRWHRGTASTLWTTDGNIVRHEHESLNVYRSERCGHFLRERHCDFMLKPRDFVYVWLIFSSIKINIKNAVNLLLASLGAVFWLKQAAVRGGTSIILLDVKFWKAVPSLFCSPQSKGHISAGRRFNLAPSCTRASAALHK